MLCQLRRNPTREVQHQREAAAAAAAIEVDPAEARTSLDVAVDLVREEVGEEDSKTEETSEEV